MAAHISLIHALAVSRPTLLDKNINFPKFAAIGKILLSLFRFEDSTDIPPIKSNAFLALQLALLPHCSDEELWLMSYNLEPNNVRKLRGIDAEHAAQRRLLHACAGTDDVEGISRWMASSNGPWLLEALQALAFDVTHIASTSQDIVRRYGSQGDFLSAEEFRKLQRDCRSLGNFEDIDLTGSGKITKVSLAKYLSGVQADARVKRFPHLFEMVRISRAVACFACGQRILATDKCYDCTLCSTHVHPRCRLQCGDTCLLNPSLAAGTWTATSGVSADDYMEHFPDMWKASKPFGSGTVQTTLPAAKQSQPLSPLLANQFSPSVARGGQAAKTHSYTSLTSSIISNTLSTGPPQPQSSKGPLQMAPGSKRKTELAGVDTNRKVIAVHGCSRIKAHGTH